MKLLWMTILWAAAFCCLLQIRGGKARSIMEPLNSVKGEDPSLDWVEMPGMGKRFARALGDDDDNVTTMEPLTTINPENGIDIYVIILDMCDWLRWFWWW
ncbi:unnamed protein product [Larinioides sclopetarius]|uniref:Uncharacterized protein n=1 Tax=Larinioides sclopetarius TaxID=280406 RepID=A0AAV2AHB8_9ARAC